MRTDLPLHSKSPNRARHLTEIKQARVDLETLTRVIAKTLRDNYQKKELIKIFFMLKEWRELYFSIRQRKNYLVTRGYEGNLPRCLRDLLDEEYPQKQKVEETL